MSRRRLKMAGALAVVALGLSSVVPFIWPRQDHPSRADAVVVLSGDHGERLALAQRMIASGMTSTLVLAGEPDTLAVDRMCGAELPYEVVCVRPAEDNTRNEARTVADLAIRRGWRHLIVATTNVHVTRVRLLFERCVEGDVEVIGANAPYDRAAQLRVVIHEWLGTAQALTVKRRC